MRIVDFEKVARDNYASVYARAFRMTRNADWAGDLAQSTFERCLCALPRDLPESKVRSWLFVVLRNLFLDATRSAAYRWIELGEGADVRSCCLDEAPERPRWEVYSIEDVRRALQALPTDLCRPYEMHVLAGLSYLEIARLLELTLGTIGTRIHRAKRQLRAKLTERSGHPGREHWGDRPPGNHSADARSSGRDLEMRSRTQENGRSPFDRPRPSPHQAIS